MTAGPCPEGHIGPCSDRLARPSPTRSKIFYRVRRLFTCETKVRGIAIAKEKVLPRRSCRWWPYCESVTVVQKTCLFCSALLCSALPCPNWPLSIILHGATSHSRQGSSNDSRELDTQILRKLRSDQKDRARKMHHATALTFIDDVSRDVVRAINR